MERNRLSLEGAAKALGISRRMAAYYKSGERLAPKTILLACRGYETLAGARPLPRPTRRTGQAARPA